MQDSQLKDEILSAVEGLSVQKQQRVLAFARSIRESPALGVRGTELTCFSGSLSPEAAAEISNAIEAGCEQVDRNEW